jgi:hypothetical protein
MLWSLERHPESQGGDGLRVEVDVTRPAPGLLSLDYMLTGDTSDVRLPAPGPTERTDDLWRTTCFEAFVRTRGGERYCELNFAPSTCWAAYRLVGYRKGMAPIDRIDAPTISGRSEVGRYQLQVAADLGRSPDLPASGVWRIGLSVVLEHRAGGMSYWALAHPPGKPDFHHPDSFALELGPTDPA